VYKLVLVLVYGPYTESITPLPWLSVSYERQPCYGVPEARIGGLRHILNSMVKRETTIYTGSSP
jgi:hypothetical protein